MCVCVCVCVCMCVYQVSQHFRVVRMRTCRIRQRPFGSHLDRISHTQVADNISGCGHL